MVTWAVERLGNIQGSYFTPRPGLSALGSERSLSHPRELPSSLHCQQNSAGQREDVEPSRKPACVTHQIERRLCVHMFACQSYRTMKLSLSIHIENTRSYIPCTFLICLIEAASMYVPWTELFVIKNRNKEGMKNIYTFKCREETVT